jgi:L-seryl-tRNA(Ser) seleniumtransferase
MTLAGLEATLSLYHDPERARQEIPVLRMLTEPLSRLEERAGTLAAALPDWCQAVVVQTTSAVGGGSFPGASLPTAAVALDPGPEGADALARRLRLGGPPIIGRIAEGKVLLDPRTLPEDSAPVIVAALTALASP